MVSRNPSAVRKAGQDAPALCCAPRSAAVVKAQAYGVELTGFLEIIRSLICDAAIIRPSQYGQTVIRCTIKKKQ